MIILSTWSFGMIGNAAAWPVLASGGSAIEALETAINAVEIDPRVDSVGLGGLPDVRGKSVLDAAVMLSPRQWGSVIGVERYERPFSIARAVMNLTSRGIRIGDGAELVAEAIGMSATSPTNQAAVEWWARHHDPRQTSYMQPLTGVPFRDVGDGRLFPEDEVTWYGHDTVGVIVIDGEGRIAAGTSTSGTPLKAHGRVGDSAIIGHGLYTVPGVGAAVCTGTGELLSSVCAAYAAVRQLMKGAGVAAAIEDVMSDLQRAVVGGQEQAAVIVIDGNGEFAAGSLQPGFNVSVSSQKGHGVFTGEVFR
jgi:N4-(beta-N-acetylglucosaminyl)-L-asparaginase